MSSPGGGGGQRASCTVPPTIRPGRGTVCTVPLTVLCLIVEPTDLRHVLEGGRPVSYGEEHLRNKLIFLCFTWF